MPKLGKLVLDKPVDKCAWCDKPAQMWTYRLEDTGKRYLGNGRYNKVERPDHFIALCPDCASERINNERGVDWKFLERGGDE